MEGRFHALLSAVVMTADTRGSGGNSDDSSSSSSNNSPSSDGGRKPSLVIYTEGNETERPDADTGRKASLVIYANNSSSSSDEDEKSSEERRKDFARSKESRAFSQTDPTFVSYIDDEDGQKGEKDASPNTTPEKKPSFMRSRRGRSRSGGRLTAASMLPLMLDQKSEEDVAATREDGDRAPSNVAPLQGHILRRSQSSREVSSKGRRPRWRARMRRKGSFAFGRSCEDIKEDEEDEEEETGGGFVRGFRGGLRRTLTLGSVLPCPALPALQALSAWNKSFRAKLQERAQSFRNLDRGGGGGTSYRRWRLSPRSRANIICSTLRQIEEAIFISSLPELSVQLGDFQLSPFHSPPTFISKPFCSWSSLYPFFVRANLPNLTHAASNGSFPILSLALSEIIPHSVL